MKLVKLDAYEYELRDIYVKDEYFRTAVFIEFDNGADPELYDVFSELSDATHIHIDGKYYISETMETTTDPRTGVVSLKLLLIEDIRKVEIDNEVS